MNALSRFLPAAAALAVLAFTPAVARAQAAADSPGPHVSPTYRQMRQEALTVRASELDWERRRPPVWGAIMDVGLPSGAVATLVVFADGTTSLYASTGGGIVGAGPQRDVRHASDEFLEVAGAANAALANHEPADQFPLPTAGRVRFYLRTDRALRSAEASEDELKAGGHALSALYAAGQEVLAKVRPLSQYNP